jgi:hypothetical protein
VQLVRDKNFTLSDGEHIRDSKSGNEMYSLLLASMYGNTGC